MVAHCFQQQQNQKRRFWIWTFVQANSRQTMIFKRQEKDIFSIRLKVKWRLNNFGTPIFTLKIKMRLDSNVKSTLSFLFVNPNLLFKHLTDILTTTSLTLPKTLIFIRTKKKPLSIQWMNRDNSKSINLKHSDQNLIKAIDIHKV